MCRVNANGRVFVAMLNVYHVGSCQGLANEQVDVHFIEVKANVDTMVRQDACARPQGPLVIRADRVTQ